MTYIPHGIFNFNINNVFKHTIDININFDRSQMQLEIGKIKK